MYEPFSRVRTVTVRPFGTLANAPWAFDSAPTGYSTATGFVVDAERGLILTNRHLVMPGRLDETRAILQWIAEQLGSNTFVNLMDQYHPAGPVLNGRYPEIGRSLSSREYAKARQVAQDAGLRRLDERAASKLALRLRSPWQ